MNWLNTGILFSPYFSIRSGAQSLVECVPDKFPLPALLILLLLPGLPAAVGLYIRPYVEEPSQSFSEGTDTYVTQEILEATWDTPGIRNSYANTTIKSIRGRMLVVAARQHRSPSAVGRN